VENQKIIVWQVSPQQSRKKGSKLATQLPASEFVLETFGNARTLFNPNASRFRKYMNSSFQIGAN
jgi:chitin synthase